MRWAIEICRYCAKKAEWPGCEHWETKEGSGEPWTRVIVVRTSTSTERAIEAEIERLASLSGG